MDDASSLATKLRQDGARLRAFARALGEREQSAQVYTDETLWTVRNVIAHLMSAERSLLHLLREVRDGGLGVDEGFAIDRFNAREQTRYEQLNWEELLGSFQKLREEMIDFVENSYAARSRESWSAPFSRRHEPPRYGEDDLYPRPNSSARHTSGDWIQVGA